MKTIPQIKKMIAETEAIFEDPKAKSKHLKKAHKLSAYYRSAVQYLETGPREDFVRAEVERMETRVDQIKAGYKGWIKANPYEHAALKEPQKAYERSVDLAGVKRRLNFLKFILSN